jgi:hypothetical protein
MNNNNLISFNSLPEGEYESDPLQNELCHSLLHQEGKPIEESETNSGGESWFGVQTFCVF